MEKNSFNFFSYRSQLLSEEKSTLEYYSLPNIHWNVSEGLCQKVTSQGEFRPFFGDTVVFPLWEPWDKKLIPVLRELSSLPFMAEKLHDSTLHMTLHDLKNGNELFSLEENKNQIQHIFSQIEREYKGLSLEFELREILPCVNTSLVLTLLPRTEKDYTVLMKLYRLFDEVVKLSYFLRPHITLGYFKPYSLTSSDRLLLQEFQSKHSRFQGQILTLEIKNLVYQSFRDMNHYETLLRLLN